MLGMAWPIIRLLPGRLVISLWASSITCLAVITSPSSLTQKPVPSMIELRPMGGRTRQDSNLHDARSDVLDCISEIHIIPPRDLSCDRYGHLDTKMLSIESVGGDTRSALPRSTSFKAASQVNRHFVRISIRMLTLPGQTPLCLLFPNSWALIPGERSAGHDRQATPWGYSRPVTWASSLSTCRSSWSMTSWSRPGPGRAWRAGSARTG